MWASVLDWVKIDRILVNADTCYIHALSPPSQFVSSTFWNSLTKTNEPFHLISFQYSAQCTHLHGLCVRIRTFVLFYCSFGLQTENIRSDMHLADDIQIRAQKWCYTHDLCQWSIVTQWRLVSVFVFKHKLSERVRDCSLLFSFQLFISRNLHVKF